MAATLRLHEIVDTNNMDTHLQWWPLEGYWTYAFAIACSIYVTVKFVGEHLSGDAKAHLSLWLQGDYDSTWGTQLTILFNSIFGERHFSLRCFTISCIQSLFLVLTLFCLLYASATGGEDTNSISILKIAFFCILLNFLPDYLSLCGTRYLVKRMQASKSLVYQLLILLLDILISFLIICVYIFGFFIIFVEAIPVLQDPGILRFVSIFFFSSFFTSAFAWIYFFGTSIVRFTSKYAKGYLLISRDPEKSLALLLALFYLVPAVIINFVLSKAEIDIDIYTSIGELIQNSIESSYLPSQQNIFIENKNKIISILFAYLLFLWMIHSIVAQGLSAYLHARRNITLYKLQAYFSLIMVAIVTIKLVFPTFFESILFESNLYEEAAVKYLLVPQGLPKWQLASGINGIISFILYYIAEVYVNKIKMAEEFRFDRIFENMTKALRFISALLSAYTFCNLLYVVLTIHWHFQPLCTQWFQWEGACNPPGE